jgi:hypothetical protein
VRPTIAAALSIPRRLNVPILVLLESFLLWLSWLVNVGTFEY